MAITKEQDKARPTGTLGVERWVQFSYAACGITLAWFLIKSSTAIWTILADTVDTVPEPNGTAIAVGSGLVAFIVAVVAYRSKTIHTFVVEVCVELSKVSWPTRKETRSQTVVVLIVSVIAAVILGVYDAIWSHITDLIYNV
ncbi:MAG: preprotein translocase subunit SecE [Deltaproteobacteria bacterium]|nr:preprotein translocase subunit SecE [Deltaproteobacteria bacterium]MBW1875643.1 preprotein translocase subunit SecE [Deltaproteobacteria bacterium]MBW2211926.1 preprotein translocase subunit SecE [Deltaproteobacteria bacterium]MBW2379823.1 preprotein translocase subunit SecE [Deltaproteobacteria bacterium]MBW2629179.1 preprotein translocase subunit SecE [Deltaproteobacteria bacterium]